VQSNRKISNFLISRNLQLRYWLFNFSFSVITGAIIITIFMWWLKTLAEAAGKVNQVNDVFQTYFVMAEAMPALIIAVVVALVIIGVVSLIFTIIMTHSVFGPVVAIRRFIDHLKRGLYDREFRLRKRDELKTVAKELDELRQILYKKQQEDKK
jgi:signal transduction histidine kinase